MQADSAHLDQLLTCFKCCEDVFERQAKAAHQFRVPAISEPKPDNGLLLRTGAHEERKIRVLGDHHIMALACDALKLDIAGLLQAKF